MADMNYAQWKKELHRKARLKRALLAGHFELTGCCNLSCKMCYVHNLDHAAAKSKELSTQEWKDIFDEAYRQGLMFATLTGGECLLRPDFMELYLHLWKKRVILSVCTNGTLLNDDYVAFFKQYKPEQVQISLYGSSEEGYLRVTGHKGFEKTVWAIRSLKEAGVNVRVVVTASRYLYEDYIPTLQYIRNNRLPYKSGEINLIPNRDDKEKTDYFLTQDEIVALEVGRISLDKALHPVENTPEPAGKESEAPRGFACNAGNCVATVTWDGRMYPCATATIGEGADVRTLGFAKAWEATKTAALDFQQPVECVGCVYDEVCVKCPVLRSPNKDGHCDPAVCELTRRLVAAGVKKLPEKA